MVWGNPLPQSAKKCIASWRKFLPDYEIKEWNESNFDVNIIPYTAAAYKAKKYAFVSDYARFWILYRYGGLYFDTDVEVLKHMDSFIADGPFMGSEFDGIDGLQYPRVAAGLGLGAYPEMKFYKEIMKAYTLVESGPEGLHRSDGKKQETVVDFVTNVLIDRGLQKTAAIQDIEGIRIYPVEYMCPKNYLTSKVTITDRTLTIHHYDSSWWKAEDLMALNLRRTLHLPSTLFWSRVTKFLSLTYLKGPVTAMRLIFKSVPH